MKNKENIQKVVEVLLLVQWDYGDFKFFSF